MGRVLMNPNASGPINSAPVPDAHQYCSSIYKYGKADFNFWTQFRFPTRIRARYRSTLRDGKFENPFFIRVADLLLGAGGHW